MIVYPPIRIDNLIVIQVDEKISYFKEESEAFKFYGSFRIDEIMWYPF